MSQSLDTVSPSFWSRLGAVFWPSIWLLFSLAVLSTAIVLPLLWLLPESAMSYFTEKPAGMVLLNALQYTIAFGAVVGLPLFIRKTASRDVNIIRKLLGVAGRLRLRDVVKVPLAWLAYFATTLLAVGLASNIPGFDVDQAQDVGFKNLTTNLDLVLGFIGLVVLAPIAEELLFRGYLFGKIRAVNGFWVSAIATSLVFGFAHLQWNVGIDTFVLSLFLCWLREKTGSIWAGMLLHALKNGIAYTFLFILAVQ